jgi:hypothetical protein
MNLNALLKAKTIDPKDVLVLRHTPLELKLRRKLPNLAAERPDVFNAYQQTQGKSAEKAMQRAKFVASFIGQAKGNAVFVGLYKVGKAEPLNEEGYWNIPALMEMKQAYGMKGFCPSEEGRTTLLWFGLQLTDHYAEWKGKLVVTWPSPLIKWYRWSDRSEIPVVAILRESELVQPMPRWDNLSLTWRDLSDLPKSWRDGIRQWRAIYYIWDVTDRKGYVGSAYGEENLLGRWRTYAKSGHGDNRLLRERDPEDFTFTILELVSPAMDSEDVIRRESTWKKRLHTRAPHGLNDN